MYDKEKYDHPAGHAGGGWQVIGQEQDCRSNIHVAHDWIEWWHGP